MNINEFAIPNLISAIPLLLETDFQSLGWIPVQSKIYNSLSCSLEFMQLINTNCINEVTYFVTRINGREQGIYLRM